MGEWPFVEFRGDSNSRRFRTVKGSTWKGRRLHSAANSTGCADCARHSYPANGAAQAEQKDKNGVTQQRWTFNAIAGGIA
jgi:hypothetical protein